MNTSRGLIVNADDYGLTRGVSRGIREAHRRGIVTSTTAMMNMPGVAGDLELAMGETPRLGLGVHLVLTAGRPTLPPEQLSGLVSKGGGFLSLNEFTLTRTQLDLEQIRREWRAQIETFVAATGQPPDHLDSHHHTSFFTAGLFATMLELARDYGCAIRNPLRTLGDGGMPPDVQAEFTSHAPLLLERFSPRANDIFAAGFYDEGATLPDLLSMLERLPEGTTELMCHPAHVDDDLVAVSGYLGPRERELSVLTDPSLALAIDRGGITLRTFAEVN